MGTMIRNVTTKHGTRQEAEVGTETDYNDACDLVASPAWTRYFLRKVAERRADLGKSLETLDSNDIAEFKKIQAKIEAIDEILKIPTIDIKNLRA
jgi:hypothetical protein